SGIGRLAGCRLLYRLFSIFIVTMFFKLYKRKCFKVLIEYFCLLRLSIFIVISISTYFNDTTPKLLKNKIARYRLAKEVHPKCPKREQPRPKAVGASWPLMSVRKTLGFILALSWRYFGVILALFAGQIKI